VSDIVLRAALIDDLAEASALCLRSKAHWGYAAEFIEACRDELTLDPQQLAQSTVVVGRCGGRMVGIAQISCDGTQAELDKLFIEPDWIGQGAGRVLFNWARETARARGAARLVVTADPFAARFYETMGCTWFGQEPSGSIPGRMLGAYRMEL